MGHNYNRWVPANTEDDFLVYIPKNSTGWASRFPDLTGLEGIRPKRRLEFLPYAASNGVFDNNAPPGDPFNDGSHYEARAGGDMKMGIGPNLTLDATFNPDFGQVEADPAEVNLSAFETFYSEKRPFFTEGSQLLNGQGASCYYSRRIGSAPHGLADRLNRRAFTGGLDWDLRLDKGKYDLTGYAGFSRIEGDSQAIAGQQLSSRRYYQRPDVDYVRFDPSRTSLSGYAASLNLSKNGGRHWLWEAGFNAESPGLELNDLGRLGGADDIDLHTLPRNEVPIAQLHRRRVRERG